MNQHLGVRVAAELMTPCAQPLAQTAVVVDLAVEHDRDRTVLVVNRLRTTGHVDDGEAPHGETDRVAVERARPVRTTAEDDVVHRLRSEEHTSELQSPCNLVCRLLLEK